MEGKHTELLCSFVFYLILMLLLLLLLPQALYFRHKVALKAETDDSSSTSSEISFKWDGGSCSSASSVRSPLSLASTSRNDRMVVKNPSRLSVRRQSPELDPNLLGSPKSEDHVRNGQWITTDSECEFCSNLFLLHFFFGSRLKPPVTLQLWCSSSELNLEFLGAICV